MTTYEKIKAFLLLVVVVSISVTLYRVDKLLRQGQQTLQTYGKLGNESRKLVAQEKAFLDTSLPQTFNNVNTTVNNLSATLTHLQSSSDKMGELAVTLGQTSQQATQTLAAAQNGVAGVAQAATETLQGTQGAIQQVGSAVGSAQQALTDLDKVATDPKIQLTLTDIQGTAHNLNVGTAQGAVILADARRVTDKVSTNFLRPTPWYKQTWKYLFQGGTLYWDFTR